MFDFDFQICIRPPCLSSLPSPAPAWVDPRRLLPMLTSPQSTPTPTPLPTTTRGQTLALTSRGTGSLPQDPTSSTCLTAESRRGAIE